MPLQTARCIVMREPTVTHLESSADDDENDHSSKPPQQRSAQHSRHVVFKALRDNVDPYDYECDSETDDDDYDDYSNTSVEEEATSCSSSSSSESSNDDDDDGDVATTTNAHRTVRFGTPLVTATFTRPVTTTEKKPELYYTEREYREFRRQFGRSRRRSQPHGTTLATTTATVVQFHVNVVTEIHETCHMLDNPSELYYSRTELQGFLDEFVASLAQGM